MSAKNKKLNVMSLFDGISCGRLACVRAGLEVENYYSSEIDKYAIQITQKKLSGHNSTRRCSKY